MKFPPPMADVTDTGPSGRTPPKTWLSVTNVTCEDAADVV
jgi:hypothetical protein